MSKHGDKWESPCGRMVLHCGRWQDQLAYVERCDAVIVDAPYSERTHGADSQVNVSDKTLRSFLSDAYHYWTADVIAEFVASWSARCSGWIASITDHILQQAWLERMAQDRYAFAPVPIIESGRNVRLLGDGPACWALWLCVARPASLSKWGALPGGYAVKPERGKCVVGGKPLSLMQAIVKDYSKPHDLIVDPCAGGGTTLLAAAIEGRRAIGAELDPNTYDLAVKRLSKGYTPKLNLPALPKPKQGDLI